MENVKRNLWGLRIEWMLPSCSAWWDVVKPCKQRTRLGGHLIRNLRLGKALRSTWVGSAVQCCFLGVGMSALSWGLKRRVTWADSHQSSWRLGGVTSRPNLDGRSHEEEHWYHKFRDGGITWRYLWVPVRASITAFWWCSQWSRAVCGCIVRYKLMTWYWFQMLHPKYWDDQHQPCVSTVDIPPPCSELVHPHPGMEMAVRQSNCPILQWSPWDQGSHPTNHQRVPATTEWCHNETSLVLPGGKARVCWPCEEQRTGCHLSILSIWSDPQGDQPEAFFNVFAAQVLWDNGRRGKSVQHLPWGLQHSEVTKVVHCQQQLRIQPFSLFVFWCSKEIALWPTFHP